MKISRKTVSIVFLLTALFRPLPAPASGVNFNDTTNIALAQVSNNVGIGTTTPQGGFVVTNGNVGIGTWAPVQLLDVKGTTRVANFIMSGQSPSNGFVLSATDSSGDTTWIPSTVGGGWTVVGSNTYLTTPSNNVGIGTSTPQASFVVNNGNVGIGTWTAAGGNLIVNGGGNVGISTVVPGTLLDVNGSIRTRGTSSNYFGDDNKASITASAATAGDMKFLTNSAEIMRITNGGNLGIGSTAPGFPLEVFKSGASYPISWTNGTSRGILYSDNTLVIVGSYNNYPLSFITNNSAPQVTLSTSGNLGIGSTNPGKLLDIAGTARMTGLTMSGQSPSPGYVLTASNSSGDATWTVTTGVGNWTKTGNDIYNSNSGNVGIGTTGPVSRLSVLSASENVAGGITFMRSASPGQYMAKLYEVTGDAKFELYSGTNEKIHFNSVGDVWFNTGGNVGIGSTVPQTKLDVAGDMFVESGNALYLSNSTTKNNSYIYSPVANQIRITTNGSERVSIDNTGNVGIGTTVPNERLRINASGVNRLLRLGDGTSTDAKYSLYDNGSGSAYMGVEGSVAGNVFTGTTAYSTFLVNGNANDLQLGTNGAVNVTVKNGGNVGIGTTVPDFKLTVTGGGIRVADGNQIQIGVSGTSGLQLIGQSGTQALIGSMDAVPLIFRTNSAEKMRIDSSGNVGIGSTAPGAKLDLAGSAASTTTLPAINLNDTAGNGNSRNWQIANGQGPYGSLDFLQSSSAGGSPIANTRVTFDLNGKVGIGLTGPGAQLHIKTPNGTTTSLRMQLGSSAGNGSQNGIVFSDVNDTAKNAIGLDGGDTNDMQIMTGTAMRFYTNSNLTTSGEAMRITSAGNVGIGTTVPSNHLNVVGSGAQAAVSNNGTGAVYQTVGNTGNTIYLGAESSSGGAIATGSSANAGVIVESGTNPIQFAPGNTVAMTLINGGNVGIGTTVPSTGNLSISSAGGNAVALVGAGTANQQYRVTSTGADGLFGVYNSTGAGLFTGGLAYATGIGSGNSTALEFATNSATRMTIDTAGNLGIGVTNPNKKLEVNGDLQVDSNTIYGSGGKLGAIFDSNGGNTTWTIGNAPTDQTSWNLQVNTSAAKSGGGSWSDTSDERLKTNIQPITGALDKLIRLNPINFQWRNPSLHANETTPGGFIAQQIIQVFPEFVSSVTCKGVDCDLVGGKGHLNYGLTLPFKFDAYVVAAIKELAQENKALKAQKDEEISDLKARVEQLEKRVLGGRGQGP